jgi:hypothetical protein
LPFGRKTRFVHPDSWVLAESTGGFGNLLFSAPTISMFEDALGLVLRTGNTLGLVMAGLLGDFSSTAGAGSSPVSCSLSRGFEFVNPVNWWTALTLCVESVRFFGFHVVLFTGMSSVSASTVAV